MIKIYKFSLIIFSILVLNGEMNCAKSPNSNKFCNKKSENQMDVSLARLLVFGQKDFKFPENGQQLRPFCNEVKRVFDRVNRYVSLCLNQFGKDAAKVILHSVTQELNSVCKSGRVNKRAKNLLDAAICGNEGNMRFYDKCYKKLIDNFQGALNAVVNMRVPISCCNFYEFLRCMDIEGEGIASCIPRVRDFFQKWIGKMFEGITQLLCVGYDDSNAQCETIIKEGPPRNTTRYKSVLLPLINIAKSLGDEQIPKKQNNS